MTSPVQFQANDWMIFLDGVQIPFIAFSFSTGRDAVPQGVVQVEPDSILTAIRPNAIISIFFKDNYLDSTDPNQAEPSTEDRYIYFGGGEVTSITVDKKPNSKSTQLTFSHEMAILDQHKAVAMGVSGSFTSVIVSGTTVINPFTTSQTDLFSVKTLGVIDQDKRDTSYSFSTRLLGAIAWFSSGNACLRNRISQHRLMNKFVSIDSRMTEDLITRSLAPGFSNSVQDSLSAGQSVLDVIRNLNAVPDYRLYTIPTPPFLDSADPSDYYKQQAFKSLHKPVVYPFNNSSDANFANQYYTRSWARHDILLTPNLYFAAPPPCNIIFPDFIQSISYTRTFNSEVTRTVYEDTLTSTAAPRLMFAATDKIPGLGSAKSPLEFWGAVEQMYESRKDVKTPTINDSPYARIVKDESSETVNLLNSVADSELAKGIITAQVPRDSEYMIALTASSLLPKPENRKTANTEAATDKLRSILKSDPTNAADDDASKYVKYVQTWLDYKHSLSRFNRSAQISVKGNRWLVPGFTGVVMDQDVSLMFMIESVALSVDSSGDENTVISVSNVRPIQDIPTEMAAASSKLANDVSDLKKSINDTIKTVYASERKQVDDLVQSIVDQGAALGEQFKKAAARNDLLDFAKTAFTSLTGFRSSAVNIPPVVNDSVAMLKYLNTVKVLVALGEQVFSKSLGANRNTAGVVAMKRYPDLANQWLNLTSQAQSGSTIDSTETLLLKLTNFSKTLGSLINATLVAQEEQALAGEPAFASTISGDTDLNYALVSMGSKLRDMELALRSLLKDIENIYDLPAPPSFYQSSLINLIELDDLYTRILGTKKSFYANLLGPVGWSVSDNTLDLSNLNSKAIGDSVANYTSMVKCIRGLYTEGWSKEIARPGGDSQGWQHRTFLKRGHQTLRQYLATHGFQTELSPNMSSEPTPTKFFRMLPAATNVGSAVVYSPTGQPTSYEWDNSVVSRLVDPYHTSQTALSLGLWSALQGGGSPIPGRGSNDFDPLVEARRKEARDPSLCAQFRQQQIINYSRRHMGSRAYRGD